MMVDQLESVRNFFPVEATAAYVSLVGILKANNVGPGQYDYEMLAVIGALTLVNGFVYHRFRGLTDWRLHILLACGFVLWAINSDIPRFRDIMFIGPLIELSAPVGLVFYVLITSFAKLPVKQDGGH